MVAEGVETQHQVQVLRAQQVEVVQGNIVSEAVPADLVASFIASDAAPWQDVPA